MLGGGKIVGWCFMGRGVLGWLLDAVGQVLFYELALVQMGAGLLVTTPEAFCTMIGLSCSVDSCWWCSVAPLLSIAEVNRVF